MATPAATHDTAQRGSAGRVCFVACVESGILEAQTVRLAESIRRFGGALSQSEILAVTARVGPPLSRSTKLRFGQLGIRHERVSPVPGYGWFHFLNKPLAMLAAERLTDADLVVWVDSDIVFLGEPTALLLEPEMDFAACVPDNGVVGTTGPGSTHDSAWQRLCNLLDVRIDDLPWVTTHVERERIRLCFNSGLFVYRRGIGFPQTYLDACTSVLRANFGFTGTGPHFIDQANLGLSMLKAGLRWRELPYSYNVPMTCALASQVPPVDLADAVVLHYHDCMGADFWPTLLSHLHEDHAAVHRWLRGERPLADPAAPLSRVLREGLRVVRGIPRRRYHMRMRRA